MQMRDTGTKGINTRRTERHNETEERNNKKIEPKATSHKREVRDEGA